MRTNKSMIPNALPLALGAALVALGSGCTQPKLNCTSAHGPFAAVYELKSGDPMSPCGSKFGDVLGMQTYFATGGLNGTPKFSEPSLSIRSEEIGDMVYYALERGVAGDAEHYALNALGDFSAGLPDESDFCMVPDLEAADVTLPAIDEIVVDDDPMTPDVDESEDSQPAQAAITARHEWSNAKFLVSADAQGTQFEADLKYTQDGCTAEYHVLGVYPVVGCESDADCDDDKNGINPSFAVKCETNLGLCVLREALPAYE